MGMQAEQISLVVVDCTHFKRKRSQKAQQEQLLHGQVIETTFSNVLPCVIAM
jgi:hypothetical protein